MSVIALCRIIRVIEAGLFAQVADGQIPLQDLRYIAGAAEPEPGRYWSETDFQLLLFADRRVVQRVRTGIVGSLLRIFHATARNSPKLIKIDRLYFTPNSNTLYHLPSKTTCESR